MSIRRRVSAVVWNETQDRARAPWRIVVPLIPLFAIVAPIGVVLIDRLPIPVILFVSQLVLAVTAFVVFAVSTRYLDCRRSIWEYGLAVDRQWSGELIAGFAIGVVAVVAPYLLGAATGLYEVSTALSPGAVGLWLGLLLLVLGFLCTGFWEELFFRGVFMTNAAEGLRGRFSKRHAIVVALVLQAVVFGVLHVEAWATQAPHPAFVLTWILSGLVFGVLYLLSDGLALPIGVHAAVNTARDGLISEVTPAESEMAMLFFAEPVVRSPAFGHGGVMMVSQTLLAAFLGVLWVRYATDSKLDLWRHPSFFVTDADAGVTGQPDTSE